MKRIIGPWWVVPRDTPVRVLEIFVTPDCFGCEMALQLAESVRSRALPHIDIRLIDLSAPGVERPPAVFAVPTYLLDGRVLSLGNPEEDWLIEKLASPNGCHPARPWSGGVPR